MSSAILSANTLLTGTAHANAKLSIHHHHHHHGSSPEKSATATKQQQRQQVHNPDYEMTQEEVKGVQDILNALTDDEKASLADVHMPLRHFRAEKSDTLKAIAALRRTLQWRKDFGVAEILSLQDKNDDGSSSAMLDLMSLETASGKMYVRGRDNDGRACVYMRPGRENTHNPQNNMKHLVYQLEKAVACSERHGRSKICMIIDYDGFRIRDSPPMSTSKQTLEILQFHYPERLYRAYVCNPPWVFTTFWTMIKPFIDPITKTKICFCVGAKGMQKIADDMGGMEEKGKYHLEKCAGGIEEHLLRDFDGDEYVRLPMNVAFDEENYNDKYNNDNNEK